MESYIVGQKFPHNNYLNKGNIFTLMLNDTSFDLVGVLSGISKQEIEDWQKGSFTLYLYHANDIPFLCVSFKYFQFDVSFNILKMVEEDYINFWIENEANAVSMFLVEEKTGIIKAMRMVGISYDIANRIKEICKKQKENYKNYKEVDYKIQSIMELIPTKTMIKNAELSYKF